MYAHLFCLCTDEQGNGVFTYCNCFNSNEISLPKLWNHDLNFIHQETLRMQAYWPEGWS